VDQALVAYVAIHDPAAKPGSSRSRNRHAHIHVALRTWTFEGALSRYKVRDLVAQVRQYSGSNGNSMTWRKVSAGRTYHGNYRPGSLPGAVETSWWILSH
jgi:hypothetical protein